MTLDSSLENFQVTLSRGTRVFRYALPRLCCQHTSRQIARECLLLRKLDHPNIIRLHEFLPGEEENDIYLVFDFINTTLLIVLTLTGLRPGQVRNLTYQALRGLKYLHSAEVCDLNSHLGLVGSTLHIAWTLRRLTNIYK